MSIEEHKWSDRDISLIHVDENDKTIHLCVKSEYSPNALNIGCIYEQDAKEIAKHFQVDRGSLVIKIKELIEDLEKCAKYEYPRLEMVNKVKDLIKPETPEVIPGTLDALNKLKIGG